MSDLKRSGRAGGDLSLIRAYQDYLTKMLAIDGMKVLLLDKDTTTMVALVRTQSEIIGKEVFLVERMDVPVSKKTEAKAMHHLVAVMLIRPTEANITHLERCLKNPKYKEYHIFFTNTLNPRLLKQLADADGHGVIKQVHEYYADYVAIDPFLFSADTPFTQSICKPKSQWLSADEAVFKRNIQAILSCFLSLRMSPVTRYDAGSDLARAASNAVLEEIRHDPELFMTQKKEAPLLLILDRRSDPVTPLLLQWTYQAMVHETLGAHNCRVDMRGVQNISNELKEIVLSSTHDRFYRGSMYLNFGDLGSSVKTLVQELQRKTKSNLNIETIDDMQKFVDQYPELRQQKTNVSKHVTLMHELSAAVDSRSLMRVSELEQELACNDSHSTALLNTQELVASSRIKFADKLRSILLYALRYEQHASNIMELKRALAACVGNEHEQQLLAAVDGILTHAGRSKRSGDLYNNASIWKSMKKVASSFKGVENIYTQHKPYLSQTLDSLRAGKLSTKDFPFSGTSQQLKPKVIVVFIMGGVTYEEAYLVHQLNANSTDGTRILLGGSYIHNSSSFIADFLNMRPESKTGF